MDFKELESFVAIAKVKSFSKASEKLFLTQPALSNHISKLEKELGIEAGRTTNDGMFTLGACRCIGCCGLAPAMMINGDVYGKMEAGKVKEIIEKYRKLG